MNPDDLKCVRQGMQIADQPIVKAGMLIIFIMFIMSMVLDMLVEYLSPIMFISNGADFY